MKIREWLARFWFHPTIEAMQAQMLRYVWRWRSRNRFMGIDVIWITPCLIR